LVGSEEVWRLWAQKLGGLESVNEYEATTEDQLKDLNGVDAGDLRKKRKEVGDPQAGRMQPTSVSSWLASCEICWGKKICRMKVEHKAIRRTRGAARSRKRIRA